jgi:hypothetical protein
MTTMMTEHQRHSTDAQHRKWQDEIAVIEAQLTAAKLHQEQLILARGAAAIRSPGTVDKGQLRLSEKYGDSILALEQRRDDLLAKLSRGQQERFERLTGRPAPTLPVKDWPESLEDELEAEGYKTTVRGGRTYADCKHCAAKRSILVDSTSDQMRCASCGIKIKRSDLRRRA